MIGIILSEMDFDYELQALCRSFFPGQDCEVLTEQKEPLQMEIAVRITLGREMLQGKVMTEGYCEEKNIIVDAAQDWHKKPDKTSHPYRAWYKNQLKRMVFQLFKEIPQEEIPAGIIRRVPEWGTMTGVRPTKIPMNALLQGKSLEQVRAELEQWYCCQPDKLKLCLEIARKEAALLEGVDFSGGYSLYIGIPFCPTTCLYCSFPSYPFEAFGKMADSYLEALLQELEAVKRECSGHPLTTIYVGGGTPTTLTAGQLERLITYVESNFPVEECREWTVEAGRPDSITREKLQVLRRHGISRISINPQTMQEKTLQYIGRNHGVEEVKTAFLLARELGFDNINMDLIVGLPGETLDVFEDTLNQLRELSPDSITVHSLVIKRASKLRELLEESQDFVEQERFRQVQMDKMLHRALSYAEQEGYEPYYMYRQKNSAGHFGTSGQENIGFARPGKESLYNVLIMEEMQTIAAVGAGASTKYYHASKQIVSRTENVKNIVDYISRIDEMIARKQGKFWEKR